MKTAKRNWKLNLVLLTLAAWAGIAAALAGQQDSRSGDADPARGAALYEESCAICHGSRGQGLPQAGPRIGPPSLSLDAFVQVLRRQSGDMPAVSVGRVPDRNVAEIYAFLRTMKPATPTAARAPGNSERGKAVFASNCGGCHGALGQGIPEVGPRLSGTTRSLDDFRRQVREPSGNMAPISARRVNDAQLADVYSYLQSLPEASPRK